MTKADLKSGYVVQYRNGDYRVVMMTKSLGMVFTNLSGIHGKLEDYNDDMTNIAVSTLDIMKVYGYNCYCNQTLLLSGKDRDLLWAREEVKELTVDEISNLLGYKVKVVGSK